MQILAQLELKVNLILEFKMLIRNVILVGLGALSITTNCYADFSVQTNQWPKQEGKYGHSYNEDFYEAVTGTGDISAREEKEIESMLPYDVSERWFVRYGINMGQQKLDSVTNKSSVAATNALGVVNKDAKRNEKPSQMAVGYNSYSWHVELEYLLNDTIKYVHNPVFIGSTDYVSSSVSGDTLFLNGYFDMSNQSVIRPYVMAGLGVAFNKTNSSWNGLASKKEVTYDFAYNFGLGFRLHFINPSWMSNFFVDVNYRFYYLSKPKWDDINDNFKLQAKRSLRGFGMSLSYVF